MTAILLVDNLSSVVQYPSHAVVANEEPTGTEAFRLATLRRTDHWSPATANADAWHKTTYNRTRAFNTVVLWDHNLLGKTYRLQASTDDYGTIQTVFDGILPTIPGAGDIDDALGVVTEDLMWIKRFPEVATLSHRHFVPAMGSGQRPLVNGIVGLSISLDREMGELVDAGELEGQEERSDAGYRGRSLTPFVRGGMMPTKTSTLFGYEQLRYHLQRYSRNAPMLLVFDESRAEQAVMGIHPLGRSGLRQGDGYFYPHGEIPYVEHEPREAAA